MSLLFNLRALKAVNRIKNPPTSGGFSFLYHFKNKRCYVAVFGSSGLM